MSCPDHNVSPTVRDPFPSNASYPSVERRRTCSEASDVTAFGHGNCKDFQRPDIEGRWRRNSKLPFDFFGSVWSNLDSLRYHQELTDLTLIVQCQSIHVHRCILAAASPYFRSMYSSGMMESRSNEIELKDLDFRDVKLVVDFIYTSSASQLSRENAPNVLKIADLFLIQQLKMLCIDFITKNMITMRDCVATFSLAEGHCLESLLNNTADFISTNWEELLDTEHFLEGEPADVAAVLKSDHIVFFEEGQAFEALDRWIRHCPEERFHLLEDLLPCVRLTLISPNFLINNILNNKLISENEDAWELVKETVSYHMDEAYAEKKRLALERIRSSSLGSRMSLAPRRGPSVQCFVVLGKGNTAESAKVLCYIPVDDRWICFDDAPFRVEVHPSTVYFKGGLFVLGGELGRRVFRFALDEVVPTWHEIASLNQIRATGCCVLYHKNELYVVGGSSSKRKKKSRQRSTIEKYDDLNNRWILCEPLPAPCYRCDVVHLDSDVVLLKTYEFRRPSTGSGSAAGGGGGGGGSAEDKIHFYYGPTVGKLKEEKGYRTVEEFARSAGPPPEQLVVNCIETMSGPIYESFMIAYGQRKDIAPLPLPVGYLTVCNAKITRRTIEEFNIRPEPGP